MRCALHIYVRAYVSIARTKTLHSIHAPLKYTQYYTRTHARSVLGCVDATAKTRLFWLIFCPLRAETRQSYLIPGVVRLCVSSGGGSYPFVDLFLVIPCENFRAFSETVKTEKKNIEKLSLVFIPVLKYLLSFLQLLSNVSKCIIDIALVYFFCEINENND